MPRLGPEPDGGEPVEPVVAQLRAGRDLGDEVLAAGDPEDGVHRAARGGGVIDDLQPLRGLNVLEARQGGPKERRAPAGHCVADERAFVAPQAVEVSDESVDGLTAIVSGARQGASRLLRQGISRDEPRDAQGPEVLQQYVRSLHADGTGP
ncbi:hypothetical protein ACFQWF_20995 [Methylorubrum suomiense]